MRARAPALLSLLLTACPPFQENGVYQCVPSTGKDCVVRDANGWELDYTVQALGGDDATSIVSAGDAVLVAGPAGVFSFQPSTAEWKKADTGTAAVYRALTFTPGALWAAGAIQGAPGYSVLTSNAWGSFNISSVVVPGATTLVSVAPGPAAATALWAGTDAGHLSVFDASANPPVWRTEWAAPSATAAAVWGDAAGNGWAVTAGGEVAFWKQGGPAPLTAVCLDPTAGRQPPAGRALHGIAGLPGSASVALAVGAGGVVLKLDGAPASIPCGGGAIAVASLDGDGGGDLTAICATGPDDVIAVGRRGRVLQRGVPPGGTSPAWFDVQPPVTSDFSSVWCSTADVWALTRDGLVLHYKR